jgi:hypothetical protein
MSWGQEKDDNPKSYENDRTGNEKNLEKSSLLSDESSNCGT